MSEEYIVGTGEMRVVAGKIKDGAEEMKAILNKVDSTEVSKIRDMKGGTLLSSLVSSWNELKAQVDKVIAEASQQSADTVTKTAQATDDHFNQSIVS